MNILLDNIIYSKERQGGISTVFSEFTRFAKQLPDLKIKFFEEAGALQNYCRQTLSISDNDIIKHNHYNSMILARLLPIKVEFSEPLIYHSSFYRELIGAPLHKEITTVHDFAHNYYSGFLKRHAHNYLKYSSIKRAKGIICISNHTYQDLLKFCPPKHNQKVELIHNGVSEKYYPITDDQHAPSADIGIRAINRGFILFIGSRANYKNFNFVVSLMNDLKDEKLVVVGNPLNEKEKKMFTKDALNRTTIFTGVSNEDLNYLYNKAFVLIYPSDFEGFGIPVLEAMKAGCPVIAQRRSSIPEIAGQGAMLVDHLDLNSVKDKMLLLRDKNFKSDLMDRGFEQARKFSWEKCSKATLDFYEYIYNS